MLAEALSCLPVPTHATKTAYLFDGCPAQLSSLPGATELPTALPATARVVTASVGVFDAKTTLTGAVLCHGVYSMEYFTTVDGFYLQITLDHPVLRIWGHGQCEFLKQRLMAHCLDRCVADLLQVLGQAQVPADIPCIVEFEGTWANEMQPLKKRVISRVLKHRYPLAA